MGFEYIIFDFDGTLIDSYPEIRKCFIQVLAEYGITDVEENVLRSLVGPPLINSFAGTFSLPEKDALRAVEKYRDYYGEHFAQKIKPFEGIQDLLHALKKAGKTLAVATTKQQLMTEKAIHSYGWDEIFSFISGDDPLSPRGKKELIGNALHKIGCTDLSRAVMVGDRKYDIIGARDARIASIGVLYGCGDMEELESAGADYIVPDIEALHEMLCR